MLVLLFGVSTTMAQSDDVEVLRRALKTQQAQMLQMQAEFRAQQAQQRKTLDALQERLEQLTATAEVETEREATKAETIPDTTKGIRPHDVEAGFGQIRFISLLQA